VDFGEYAPEKAKMYGHHRAPLYAAENCGSGRFLHVAGSTLRVRKHAEVSVNSGRTRRRFQASAAIGWREGSAETARGITRWLVGERGEGISERTAAGGFSFIETRKKFNRSQGGSAPGQLKKNPLTGGGDWRAQGARTLQGGGDRCQLSTDYEKEREEKKKETG